MEKSFYSKSNFDILKDVVAVSIKGNIGIDIGNNSVITITT